MPRGLFLDVLRAVLVPSLAPTGPFLIERRSFNNRIKRDSESARIYTREKKVFYHLNMLEEVNLYWRMSLPPVQMRVSVFVKKITNIPFHVSCEKIKIELNN